MSDDYFFEMIREMQSSFHIEAKTALGEQFMIYINDKLRISKVDDNCLQIEALKETTSKSTKEITLKWMWQGYYGDLRSAMLGVLKKQLFDTAGEEIQLKDIISRIEAAEKNILEAKNKGDL